jgi:hypothetical protein
MSKYRKRHFRRARVKYAHINHRKPAQVIVQKPKLLKPKKPMRILLDQDVFAHLEAARVAAGTRNFPALALSMPTTPPRKRSLRCMTSRF